MRKLQLLIMSIATVLFISCGSLTIATEEQPYDFYYSNYNYNQINMMYLNNPRWFYDNYYIDSYGHQRYYNRHPYYIRYTKEHQRRIHTRTNHSRNIKRTNHSTSTRRATTTVRPNTRSTTTRTPTRTIRPSTTRSTVRFAPTRSARTNKSSTIRRGNSQTKRTSTVKRRN
jgi:hypothetical protein